jgi:hypothetical protein
VLPFLPRRVAFLTLTLALLYAPCLHAQARQSTLSDAEVDEIRDARLEPARVISLFMKFLDARTQKIQDLYAKSRRPGREEDTRELLEQFGSIADELSDNLDDYGRRHADLRKVLPKLVEGAERWSSGLKTPPEQETYSVERKFALESMKDLRDSATELIPQQQTWFKDHPPPKQKDSQTPGPIEIPR